MLIRRERPDDVDGVRDVVAAAFPDEARPGATPVEVTLVDALRRTEEWLPALSMVAEDDGQIVGYVVCSRAWVEEHPVLGLGPLAVSPQSQRAGVGSALMHAVLGEADALGEPLVVLLGHTDYYPQVRVPPGRRVRHRAPDPEWGVHFQARPMNAYEPAIRGMFRYAAPFNDL